MNISFHILFLNKVKSSFRTGIARSINHEKGVVLLHCVNPFDAFSEDIWFRVSQLEECQEIPREPCLDDECASDTALYQMTCMLIQSNARDVLFEMLKSSCEYLSWDKSIEKLQYTSVLRLAAKSELLYPISHRKLKYMDVMSRILLHSMTLSETTKQVEWTESKKVAQATLKSIIEIDDSIARSVVRHLLYEMESSLIASARDSKSSRFTVTSDTAATTCIRVPSCTFCILSFALHPVKMDLPVGCTLALYRDRECTLLIHAFCGGKRGLSKLPPILIPHDVFYIKVYHGQYARYKFHVWGADSRLTLSLWIIDFLLNQFESFSAQEVHDIVLNRIGSSLVDYVFGSNAPTLMKQMIFERLAKVIQLAKKYAIAIPIALKKLLRLTEEMVYVHEKEMEGRHGFHSRYLQQLIELLALAERSIEMDTIGTVDWWQEFKQCARFTWCFAQQNDDQSTYGRIPRSDFEHAYEKSKIDYVMNRLLMLQRLPQTDQV